MKVNLYIELLRTLLDTLGFYSRTHSNLVGLGNRSIEQAKQIITVYEATYTEGNI